MAILASAVGGGVQKVEWLHWLFVRGDRTISCDIDVRGDGLYTVTLFPLWATDEQVSESFTRPAQAMRWHAEMTTRLRASGWLMVEGGVVTNAA